MKPTDKEILDIKEVYYHGSCPDGTSSAMICMEAFLRLGKIPNFHSVQYGTEKFEKMVAEKGQLFVDITPPKDRWTEWVGLSPIVLDHHISSSHITIGLNGVYGTNDENSGAVLAYENILSRFLAESEKKTWKEFANLCMIRDTWKKESELWNDSCAMASSLKTIGGNDILSDMIYGVEPDFEKLLEFGKIIEKKDKRTASAAADSAFRYSFLLKDKKINVSIVNHSGGLISDIADVMMSNGADISIGWFYIFDKNDKTVVSIRTNELLNASEIASAFGGGGHKNAAGFQIDKSVSVHELCSYLEKVINSLQ